MIGDAERGEEQAPVTRQREPALFGHPVERRLQQIFEHRLFKRPAAEQQDRKGGINDRRLHHDKALVVEPDGQRAEAEDRSEEHTSELQSLMRNSYAVFCLKTTNKTNNQRDSITTV